MSVATGHLSDTERLTWLIVNWASFGSCSSVASIEGPRVVWNERVFVRRECAMGYEWHCYDGPTPREAIDKAMDAPPCAPDDRNGCVNSPYSRDDVHEQPTETLRFRNASLLAALYERAPVAECLRRLIHARFEAAPMLSDESHRWTELERLLDDVMSPSVPS